MQTNSQEYTKQVKLITQKLLNDLKRDIDKTIQKRKLEKIIHDAVTNKT